jgi:hypothetical protein
MDHIKEQLKALLDTLNFGEDKDEFIDKFLLIVNSEVVLALVAKVPQEALGKVKNSAPEDQSEELSRVLKENVTPLEYNEVFQVKFSQNLREALTAAYPNLTKEQLAILDKYLEVTAGL